MRGRAFIGLALRNIPRNHGGIAYPPNPRRSLGRSIQREITNDPYIRAGAYAPLRDFTASRKIVLKRRNPSAQLRSTSLLAASNFAGIHPANCSHIRSRG